MPMLTVPKQFTEVVLPSVQPDDGALVAKQVEAPK